MPFYFFSSSLNCPLSLTLLPDLFSFTLLQKQIKNNPKSLRFRVVSSGGEIGIRTPGCFHINGFQDRRFRPLSHLSILNFLTSFLNLLNLHYLLYIFFCILQAFLLIFLIYLFLRQYKINLI